MSKSQAQREGGQTEARSSTTQPQGVGVRVKLITIFVLITLIPLLMMTLFFWYQFGDLGDNVERQVSAITEEIQDNIVQVGEKATADAVKALNERSQESIERLTTDTAYHIARFLYARDKDILLAAALPQNEANFQTFLDNRQKEVVFHHPWELNSEGSGWVPGVAERHDKSEKVTATLKENKKNFHYRNAEARGIAEKMPLYLEMTLVDLQGREKLKVTTGGITEPGLRDISYRENTYVKAEDYFADLKSLKPGEIYVSDVIGAYVQSKVIGSYTPAAAQKRKLAFEPELSGYAGKENPVGRRFQGLVRWATPIVRDGEITGYLTLALDHTHIMEFTDHLVPTDERCSPISDAASGNYAFMWDFKGRNISHPRDYFIVGYDPDTGEPMVPWLEVNLYDEWQSSKLPIREFLDSAALFDAQSHAKKPSKQLMAEGNVGLDCRYLNFAPQCAGWMDLTQHGGSGSFVIFWSGLWKLTSAAVIPYYTGQYSDTPRGFGFVTIGANVDEFHQPAIESAAQLETIIADQMLITTQQKKELQGFIVKIQELTTREIIVASLIMIALVILLAIQVASRLTRRITELVIGIQHFQDGDLGYRMRLRSNDEMGQLAASFNSMAGDVEAAFHKLEISAQEIGDKHSENLLLVNDMLGEIRQRVKVEEKLNRLAYFDTLTGLANRFLSLDQLSQQLSDAELKQEQVAVLFIDLDDFKRINDTLGHETGDKILIEAARRLHSAVRSTDTVGRLGGDEFIVLLGGLTDADNTRPVVENLINRFREAFKIDDRGLILTASIGIAIYPDNGVNASELLRNADTAMYHSKAQGRNTFSYFDQTMNEEVSQRLSIEEEMHGALDRGEFELYYQPKMLVLDGSIAGVEALLRWKNDVLGNISPEIFISVAEQTGYIVPIGQFVLTEALAMAKKWQQQYNKSFTMAVNLSPRQFHDPNLVPFVKEAIIQSGISKNTLELEITEGVLMGGHSYIDEALAALTELGVSIALDDFGTGYSSLSYLRRYSFDVLKIDRSFVRDMGENSTDLELVHAAIAMAHSLGLDVVAEGVETEEQLKILTDQGCEYAQGYLFSKPVPAAEMTEMLDREGKL